jgi:membrane protein DedA with SNARE-associated domain
VFALMAVDALLPAGGELIMLFAGALAAVSRAPPPTHGAGTCTSTASTRLRFHAARDRTSRWFSGGETGPPRR